LLTSSQTAHISAILGKLKVLWCQSIFFSDWLLFAIHRLLHLDNISPFDASHSYQDK